MQLVQLAACLASVGPAFAQAINTDIGDPGSPAGVPTSSYGAAGRQGVWNAHDGNSTGATALVDIAGTPTGASLTHTGGTGSFHFDNPLTFGDDEALMDDLVDVTSPAQFTLEGLADGMYRVRVYAWGPDGASFLTEVRVIGGAAGTQIVGGPWPGGHALGTTYAEDLVRVAAGRLVIEAGSTEPFGSVNGIQVEPLSSPPVAYCTAKTGPLGCTPTIGSVGIPDSLAPSGFVVSATDVRNQKVGVLLYTLDGRVALPFQGGWLCLAAPIHRTPERNSGGDHPANMNCTGAYRIDMNSYAAGHIGGKPASGLRVPGAFVQCQWWGRDPLDPFGSSLSDALQYQVAP